MQYSSFLLHYYYTSWFISSKPVLQLATLDEVVKTGVILHPAMITVDDIKDVKVPIAALVAEFDDCCPPELLKQLKGASNPEVN
ncbi:hypothetical protein Syun_029057 [Stephania yunnanensis]|uniref:Uncharacterized protein n=1 Tax=Stephania yunnanensis TaxID=152371 RepID=A0AAP0ECJ4_9MAGN